LLYAGEHVPTDTDIGRREL